METQKLAQLTANTYESLKQIVDKIKLPDAVLDSYSTKTYFTHEFGATDCTEVHPGRFDDGLRHSAAWAAGMSKDRDPRRVLRIALAHFCRKEQRPEDMKVRVRPTAAELANYEPFEAVTA